MHNAQSSAASGGRARASLRPLVGVAVAALLAGASLADAEPAPPPAQARIVVIGEGSVRVVPDRAQIRTGVTTRAKTAGEATEANAKAMTAIMAALKAAGIAATDIQTTRFSLDPVYAPADPKAEPKLAGYSVSNELRVMIDQTGRVGEILDRVVAAGATDVGNVVFLVADQGKYLDQAREAAVADARHKAALYASAAGMTLGRPVWITEDSNFSPPVVMAAAAPAARGAVPIASGEETLNVRLTVGFDAAP